MDSFQFELVSPEKLLFSGAVQSVVVPGAEGDFEVLDRHAPMMSTLRPGIIYIRETAATSQRIFVRGGFAEVGPKGLTILAEQIIRVEDLTENHLMVEIELAEASASRAPTDQARADAAHRVGQLQDIKRNLLV